MFYKNISFGQKQHIEHFWNYKKYSLDSDLINLLRYLVKFGRNSKNINGSERSHDRRPYGNSGIYCRKRLPEWYLWGDTFLLFFTEVFFTEREENKK